MTIRRKLSVGIAILLTLFAALGVVTYFQIGQLDENIAEKIQRKELGSRVALLYRQYMVLDEILRKNRENRNELADKTSANFDKIENIVTNDILPGFNPDQKSTKEKVYHSMQMEIDIARMSEELSVAIQNSDNNYTQRIFDNADSFREKLNVLKMEVLSEKQNTGIDKIETLFDETIPLVQEILTLNNYIRIKQSDYEDKKSKVDMLLGEQYDIFTHTDLERAKVASRKMVTTAVIVTLILVLTGILDVFVFSAAVNRSITMPITRLKNAMTKIGEGNFDTVIETVSQDEIGQLAACFNNTVQKLKQTTTSIENLNAEISKRKTAQEALQDAHNELEQRVEERTIELAKANGELARLNFNLDAAVRDLSRSNKELQEFAYIVAHDLKTPLRGMSTIASWILSDYAEKLDEQGKNQLDMLMSKAKQTSNMVNDILEYSKVGRKQQEIKEVDLNVLVKEIISGLDSEKNIEITVNEDLPTVICDRTQMLQVFQNLLTNAVKYMDKPEGKIHIGCISHAECSAPYYSEFVESNQNIDQKEGSNISNFERDMWIFSISDNGPGIEKCHFDRIFKIFQTASSSERTDSTGIGLAIVKKIVELNGGNVWLDSEPGKGSTFYFTFPKSKSHVSAAVL